MSAPSPNPSASHSAAGEKRDEPPATGAPEVGTAIWNVPNQLTAARLLLSLVVFALIAWHFYLAAMIVFVIAAGTDWVDGYWARRFNQVTKLGRIFDPFVDKMIICGTFVFLVAEEGSGIAAWMAVLVIAREMLVTALRGFIEQSGGDFSAKMSGKIKMVIQCAAVVASLLCLHLGEEQVGPILRAVTLGLIYAAVLSTVQSGYGYVRAALRFLRG